MSLPAWMALTISCSLAGKYSCNLFVCTRILNGAGCGRSAELWTLSVVRSVKEHTRQGAIRWENLGIKLSLDIAAPDEIGLQMIKGALVSRWATLCYLFCRQDCLHLYTDRRLERGSCLLRLRAPEQDVFQHRDRRH